MDQNADSMDQNADIYKRVRDGGLVAARYEPATEVDQPASSWLHGMAGTSSCVRSLPSTSTEQYACTCGSPKSTLQRTTGRPW